MAGPALLYRVDRFTGLNDADFRLLRRWIAQEKQP
jgi:hypothetical protein